MTDTTDAPESQSRGPVVLVGDSLVEGGPWDTAFPDLEVVNLGRSGDTTEDVEARIDDVVALAPSVVVLMVGTNDLGRRPTVEQIVRGGEDILFRLRRELPDARLVVCSVLPRERERADSIRQVNIHVRQFAPTVKAEFLDLWPTFAEEDGELKPAYTEDRMHLNDEGYDLWIGQLKPLID